jgi:murein DD-endopeptidase MepM/ murein hydrolase activator NlpD
VGTPVRVTASGTVVSAGWDGGGGKTVKVRHANGYLTGYLHLSRFADGVRAGARVRQGEVIGYVGSTGLASGPHLDYRVQLNGRWIDPQSLKSVPAEPLSALARADFERERDAMRLALAGDGAYRPSPRLLPDRDGTRLASASAASPAAPIPTRK